MDKEHIEPDYIFETSWEVCNLIGGIYTVLSTKSKTLQKLYKDKIIFIGPDIWQGKDNPLFLESDVTALKQWKNKAAKAEGLHVRTGRWNIPGKPLVILVDFQNMYTYKNDLYGHMWEWYGVDSLHAYGDYDESCIFAYTAARVIESFYRFIGGEKKNIIAHFDEWTTGMGLLYIKHNLPDIATIFTTHATSIGRSIAGNNKPLYDYLTGYFGDQMAQELNMEAKHSVEKHAAQNADAFTTVSDITARECSQLLSCTPDVVTPNGFEENFVPKKSDYTEKRKTARHKLLQTAAALTGCKPDDNTLLIATSGRYEYKNKGLDLFIDAIRRLKSRNKTDREIIAFILVPAYVDQARKDLQKRIDSNYTGNEALPEAIITHSLHDFPYDKIVNHLHGVGIINLPEDKVKVIFVPSYLKGNDGVFDLPYYDLLIGMDATVFASYYEPWGYTPLESVAFGIPTITTDLSGFGRWVQNVQPDTSLKKGVEVLHRTDSNFEEVAENIALRLEELSRWNDKQQQAASQAASALAKQAEWKKFIDYYLKAYNIALNKIKKN